MIRIATRLFLGNTILVVLKTDQFYHDQLRQSKKWRRSVYRRPSFIPPPVPVKTDVLNKFLGELAILEEEANYVLRGWANFETIVAPGNTNRSNTFHGATLVHSDKLRYMGKRMVKLHLDNNTVFIGNRYLSLPLIDIERDLDLFSDDSDLIPRFMRQNNLYQAVIPYKGTMRMGPFASKENYEKMRTKICDVTSVGSFYTMIGLLHIKYPHADVGNFIRKKIVEGANGLVSIASKL